MNPNYQNYPQSDPYAQQPGAYGQQPPYPQQAGQYVQPGYDQYQGSYGQQPYNPNCPHGPFQHDPHGPCPHDPHGPHHHHGPHGPHGPHDPHGPHHGPHGPHHHHGEHGFGQKDQGYTSSSNTLYYDASAGIITGTYHPFTTEETYPNELKINIKKSQIKFNFNL